MTENKTTINAEALKQNIKTLEGWQLKKNTVIECNYTFNNFKDITAFLNHLVDTITELTTILIFHWILIRELSSSR